MAARGRVGRGKSGDLGEMEVRDGRVGVCEGSLMRTEEA